MPWLGYCQQYTVEILAYCLMTNHMHLVAVPPTADGLHHVLKPLHMRYAQRFNRQHRMQGHVWQGRYFSAPLHVRDDTVLTSNAGWWSQFHKIKDWSRWLAEGDEPEQMTVIRRHVEKGLPCGSAGFLAKLEKKAGRVLTYRPQGRPRTRNKG